MINFLFGVTCGIIATCCVLGYIANKYCKKPKKCIVIDIDDHED